MYLMGRKKKRSLSTLATNQYHKESTAPEVSSPDDVWEKMGKNDCVDWEDVRSWAMKNLGGQRCFSVMIGDIVRTIPVSSCWEIL